MSPLWQVLLAIITTILKVHPPLTDATTASGSSPDPVRDPSDVTVNLEQSLTCFHCSSMNPNDTCFSFTATSGSVLHQRECGQKEPFCEVRRIEYMFSEVRSGQEERFVPWSLERNCSSTCRDFCVTMGARTKITYCTSCCRSPLCNTDNGAVMGMSGPFEILSLALAAVYSFTRMPD